MKTIVFDSGPLISLTTSNFLWLLEPLKHRYKGSFAITESVRREVVERPLQTRRFRLEALQILEKIEEGTLSIIDNKHVKSLGLKIMNLANSLFRADGRNIHVVDLADMEAIAAGVVLGADMVVIDERISRYLVEDPHKVRSILERRLHKRVGVNDPKLHKLHEEIKDVHVIRSTELVARAFELGMLDQFLSENVDEPKRTLVDAFLWKLRLNGAAISEREIESYKKILG